MGTFFFKALVMKSNLNTVSISESGSSERMWDRVVEPRSRVAGSWKVSLGTWQPCPGQVVEYPLGALLRVGLKSES
jgi:hypothetical protein